VTKALEAPVQRTGTLRVRSGLAALLLVLSSLAPLLAPGYFLKAHDARHSISFLVEFEQGLRAGAPWPVWSPDFAVGFGYPLWLIYAPLPYYIAEFFRVLGFGFAGAVKATWIVAVLLGASGAYLLARRWWGRGAALVAAVAFTYAPYRMVEIYVRAALGEFLALSLMPWAFLALAALWDDPRPRRAAAAAVVLAALPLTHTVSAVMFAPLLAAYLLFLLAQSVRRGDRRALIRAVGWTGAGLITAGLLAAIFIVPLGLERRYIAESQWVSATYYYARHFVYPAQLFDPSWGFGFSVPGAQDGMSFQLGLALVVLAAAGAWAGLRRGATRRSETAFLAAAFLFAVVGMLPLAEPAWAGLPLANLVQFPWRLLAVAAFAAAMLSGAAAFWMDRSAGQKEDGRAGGFALLAALVVLVAGLPYVSAELAPVRPEDEAPVAVINFELEYPDMRGMTLWSQRVPVNGDSPLIDQYLRGEPLKRVAVIGGSGKVLSQAATPDSVQAQVQADGPVLLRIYTHYFPGWRATVDGQPAEVSADPPNGLMGLALEAGVHDVRLQFGPTPVRRAAAFLSALGIAAVVALLVLERRRRPMGLS